VFLLFLVRFFLLLSVDGTYISLIEFVEVHSAGLVTAINLLIGRHQQTPNKKNPYQVIRSSYLNMRIGPVSSAVSERLSLISRYKCRKLAGILSPITTLSSTAGEISHQPTPDRSEWMPRGCTVLFGSSPSGGGVFFLQLRGEREDLS
jgi:hypothetical protein